MEERKLDNGSMDDPNPIFTLVQGHILETAYCKFNLFVLRQLLIKKGIVTFEELETLYNELFQKRLPEEFNEIERSVGYKNVKMTIDKDGKIEISGKE